jgi:hypothetical protein
MSTLQEIEKAIDRLPRDQAFELSEWLQQRLDDVWDRQFESDVREGRLTGIAEKAIAEHRAGKSKEFPGNEE